VARARDGWHPARVPPDFTRRARWRAGVRAGVPFAIAGGLLAVSFGVVAQQAGLSRTATILMSVPGGPLRRAAQGQAIVDASWAIASRGDGTFDRWLLFGSSAVQYFGWVAGTVIGAFGGTLLGDPARLGLDAVYPAFFLALLIHEVRDGRSRGVAALGAVIALALVPFTPPGVPVLVASLAALVGLTASARAAVREAS
jgi:predicted branched-subunit amino acid permease